MFAGVVAPQDPYNLAEITILDGSLPPGSEGFDGFRFHLGSDVQGRDMLSAMIYGLRISLFVSFVAVSVAVGIGLTLGMLSAWRGGGAEAVIMRIVDIQLSFPALLVALLLLAALGKGVDKVILALVLVQWAYFARTVRGAALVEIRKDYIMAARSAALPGGEAPEPGARFVHPGLAAFFEHLTATGTDPFADPDFARGFCDRVARKGARWSVEALAAAEARDGETVSFRGTGWRLTSIGRQGWEDTLLRIAALSASRAARSSLDAELVHLAAVLRAFEERPEELRSLEPKPHPIPWETLRARIGEPPAGDWAAPAALAASAARMRGPAMAEERDTTHLSVVDREGMRVALTQSIGPHFGARVADPETGVLLAHSCRMTHTPEPGARRPRQPTAPSPLRNRLPRSRSRTVFRRPAPPPPRRRPGASTARTRTLPTRRSPVRRTSPPSRRSRFP